MPLTDHELLRYSRQILLDDWDIDAQLALKNSTVLIVGVGGLGTHLALILARAGVGVLRLVDFDVVDNSNLQRQPLYFDKDVGKPKAQLAKAELAKHNPNSTIHAHALRLDDDNAKTVLAGVDLAVDCSDNFALRYALNRACVSLGVPLLSTSATGRAGQLALFEPAKTGCYVCLFGEHHTAQNTCATTGVLASTVASVGAMGADVALTFLGQGHNPLANTLAVWQGGALSWQTVRFAKNQACAVCGNQSSC